MKLRRKRKTHWLRWFALATGLTVILMMTGCATSSTSGLNFCTAYHRQQCAKGDKACLKNELQSYCLCEKETASIPKSLYCE